MTNKILDDNMMIFDHLFNGFALGIIKFLNSIKFLFQQNYLQKVYREIKMSFKNLKITSMCTTPM